MLLEAVLKTLFFSEVMNKLLTQKADGNTFVLSTHGVITNC